ncbi:MAG: endonuclease III [Sporomusaceae bacterium]|nr:endonuclease III [Sporomusaceae bacterium]
MNKKIRSEILERLENVYGHTETALEYSTPFELLIAVILSAQCTDVRVNMITKRLFPAYSSPEKILSLTQSELEEKIRDCGLFHSKAKNILAACQLLCQKHQGQVPDQFDELLALPGVGRKTANVMLSVAFGKAAIAVDTHVFRVANRLKLAVGDTPLVVEQGLMKAIPKEKWGDAHHWLIWHGRKVCKARQPLCAACPLTDLCPSSMR